MKIEFLKKEYRAIRNFYWWLFQKKKDQKWYYTYMDLQSKNGQETSKYYVIQGRDGAGLFSFIQTTMGHIIYAREHDMIPIIDMKTVPNSYLEEYELGEYNAWEFYFKQICDISLEEVLESGNYELGENSNIDLKRTPGKNGLYQKRAYGFFCQMYKQFVVFNDKTQQYCDKELHNVLCGKEKQTLGVLVRGTDYKYAKGHERQPDIDEIVKYVKRVLKKDNSFCQIYLATDEKRTEERFMQEFPDIVFVNRRTYFDQYDFSKQLLLADVHLKRNRDKYLRGLEYLSSIYILSKCGGLCGGLCGGTYGAYYMNQGKYRLFHYWDIGTI